MFFVMPRENKLSLNSKLHNATGKQTFPKLCSAPADGSRGKVEGKSRLPQGSGLVSMTAAATQICREIVRETPPYAVCIMGLDELSFWFGWNMVGSILWFR
jgi:hypothetical protein